MNWSVEVDESVMAKNGNWLPGVDSGSGHIVPPRLDRDVAGVLAVVDSSSFTLHRESVVSDRENIELYRPDTGTRIELDVLLSVVIVVARADPLVLPVPLPLAISENPTVDDEPVGAGDLRIDGGNGPSLTTMTGLAGVDVTSTDWLFARR
jgi:hypothetical protein